MTQEAKQVLMITVPYDRFEYYENNKWKIRAYDALLEALDRNQTALIVDSEGRMELTTHSENWGVHWLGAER